MWKRKFRSVTAVFLIVVLAMQCCALAAETDVETDVYDVDLHDVDLYDLEEVTEQGEKDFVNLEEQTSDDILTVDPEDTAQDFENEVSAEGELEYSDQMPDLLFLSDEEEVLEDDAGMISDDIVPEEELVPETETAESLLAFEDALTPEDTVIYDTERITVVIDTSDIYMPEDLFAGYVNSKLGISAGSVPKLRKSAGSHLTGRDALAYQTIKKYCQEVAEGERSSTQFELTLADVGLEGIKWTAQDLGLDTLVTGSTFSNEAISIILEKTFIDFDKVIKSLLVDCPYDLYWYDKTKSTSSDFFNIGASYDRELQDWTAYLIGTATISMPVASEYALDTYTMNTTVGTSVEKAKTVAQGIVKRYQYWPDYNKLVAYREEICLRTDYNYEAANSANQVPYGNPWQLIWVFDEDNSTKVTCEGYSKAFKYLCDLTSFKYHISCITVSGTTTFENSTGNHMWNIVRMGDRKNYLVDITNSDSGLIGDGGKLFLAPYASGSVNAGYTLNAAQNTKITYKYRSEMISIYTTEELTLSATAYDDNSLPSEIHDIVIQPPVAPACERTGLTQGSYCSECGEVFTPQEVVPALGHDWDTGRVTQKATCTQDGVKTYTCKRDSTHKRTEVIPAAGHRFSEWTVVREATALLMGQEERTCSVCSVKETKNIPPLDPTITLSSDHVELTIPDQETITVSDLARGDFVSYWISHNDDIASVEDGTITAKKAGNTIVSVVLASGHFKDIEVIVRNNMTAPVMSAVFNSAKGGDIRWKEVPYCIGYNVYRQRSSEGTRLVATVDDPATLQCYDTQIKDNCWGCVYHYFVRALYSEGDKTVEGPKSEKLVLQRLAPMKITSLTNSAKSTVSVTWACTVDANKALGYEIQYAESSADLYNRKGTFKAVSIDGRKNLSTTIRNLTKGNTYWFRVRCYVNYTHSVTHETTKTWSQYSSIEKVKISK